MTHPTLRYFTYEHLPKHLREISKPFAILAHGMDDVLPDGAEKSAGFRKLLEAKDCFVRAALPGEAEEYDAEEDDADDAAAESSMSEHPSQPPTLKSV